MKQIVIYTDILRPYNYVIDEMIPIIKNLLYYQLVSLGYKVVSIVDLGFKIEQFFFLNNNIASKDIYQTLDEQQRLQLWLSAKTHITNEASDYLTSFFKNSIAIGYHSSQEINNLLDKHNITYLDFFESAYRYLDDTYFAIQTNSPDIKANLLNNYALNKDKLYIQANYLKSFFIRNTSYVNIQPNSALIVCQSLVDIVLIKSDATFDTLLNYKHEIEKLATQYNVLYYKLHPYADPLQITQIREFFSSIDNAQEINHDMYELLANDNLQLIAGINSGSLYEAEFFNKKTIFFGEKYYHYHTDNGYNKNYYTLLNSNKYIFDIIFWDNILHNKNLPLSKFDIFDNYKDLIRNVLIASSSYTLSPYLQLRKFKTQIDNTMKSLDDKIQTLDNNQINHLEDRIQRIELTIEKFRIKNVFKRIKSHIKFFAK